MPPSNTTSVQGSGRGTAESAKPHQEFRQNTAGTEYPLQQQVYTHADRQLVSGDQAQHTAAGTCTYDQTGSYSISQGLQQLGAELPADILAKVVESHRGKSPMEIFLGDLYEEPATNNNATEAADGAAWSRAATTGSEEDSPNWK